MLIYEGNVNWSYGTTMAIGGLVGGYLGGMISHRANPTAVRLAVITIGFAASAYYSWKLYGNIILPAGDETGLEFRLDISRSPEFAKRVWPTPIDNASSGGTPHAFSQRSVRNERTDGSREIVHIVRSSD